MKRPAKRNGFDTDVRYFDELEVYADHLEATLHKLRDTDWLDMAEVWYNETSKERKEVARNRDLIIYAKAINMIQQELK